MNRVRTRRRPPIEAPGPGMCFEDWMDARDVFDAIRGTQRCGAQGRPSPSSAPTPRRRRAKLTYGELLDGIARTANAFRSLGLRRGDVVAYMLPSLVETQFVLWGACHGGVGPAAQPAAQGRGDRRSVPRRRRQGAGGARALAGHRYLGQGPAGEGAGAGAGCLIQVGGERDPADRTFICWRISCGRIRRAWRSPTCPGWTMSPPTSTPAARPARPSWSFTPIATSWPLPMAAPAAAGAGSDDVIVNGLPMFHVASAIFCSLAMFVAGAEVVILSPAGFRNPRVVADFWRIVERTGTTIVGGVPTALSAVVQVDPEGADLSRVRMNLCGASLLPRSVAEQMEQLTGKPVREVYGMTEVRRRDLRRPGVPRHGSSDPQASRSRSAKSRRARGWTQRLGPALPAGRARRAGGSRPERDARLQGRGSIRRPLHRRWLADHRRRRVRRRHRSCVHHGTGQGPDHPWRPQHRPAPPSKSA